MEKNLPITFVTVILSLSVGLSDDQINEVVGNVIKNENLRRLIRNVRNYEDKVPEGLKNYVREIPMNSFNVAYGDGNILQNKYGDKSGFDFEEKGRVERNYVFGFDAGNPDIHGEIRRPCQVYDTFCIRKFFSEHSKCKISGRAVPDPFYRSEGNYHFASTNISETQTDAVYGGLNDARISEFYINKVTDNLLIAITFENATKFAFNTYLKFYLRGREPVVTRDFGGIKYGSLTITVIIPHIKNLNLARSEIYTYGDNDLFGFSLGPQIGVSTDPEVVTMYAQFNANVPTEYQEEITNLGNFVAGNFIQYNICDFGLKIL